MTSRAHFDHDVNGHYARPDLFMLIVNEQPRKSVVAVTDVVDA
jgi:nitrilase